MANYEQYLKRNLSKVSQTFLSRIFQQLVDVINKIIMSVCRIQGNQLWIGLNIVSQEFELQCKRTTQTRHVSWGRGGGQGWWPGVDGMEALAPEIFYEKAFH